MNRGPQMMRSSRLSGGGPAEGARTAEQRAIRVTNGHLFPIVKAAYFFWFGAMGSLIPYLPLHYLDIGLTGRQIGLLFGVAPFMTLIAAPLWGAVADILRQHKRIMAITISGVCLCVLGIFLARDVRLLLLFAVLNTLFTAPSIALIDHTTLSLLGERRALYGRQRVWGAVGWGLMGTLVGYLTQWMGLSWSFYAFFVMMVVTLLIALRMPIESPPARIPYGAAVRVLMQRRWLIIVFVTVFVQMAARATGFGFLTVHLDDLGATRGVIGLSVAIASVSEVPIFFFGNSLLQSLGRRGTLLFSLGATCLLLLGYGLAPDPSVILLVQVFQGPALSGMWIAAVDYTRSAAPDSMGATTQALLEAVVWGLGVGTGNLVAGVLYDAAGAAVLFRVAATAVAVVGVFFFVASRSIPAKIEQDGTD